MICVTTAFASRTFSFNRFKRIPTNVAAVGLQSFFSSHRDGHRDTDFSSEAMLMIAKKTIHQERLQKRVPEKSETTMVELGIKRSWWGRRT